MKESRFNSKNQEVPLLKYAKEYIIITSFSVDEDLVTAID